MRRCLWVWKFDICCEGRGWGGGFFGTVLINIAHIGGVSRVSQCVGEELICGAVYGCGRLIFGVRIEGGVRDFLERSKLILLT